jgi:hypothetical protein
MGLYTDYDDSESRGLRDGAGGCGRLTQEDVSFVDDVLGLDLLILLRDSPHVRSPKTRERTFSEVAVVPQILDCTFCSWFLDS